jgi:hypothetical protein
MEFLVPLKIINMSKKRAFVRYTKDGMIVPGSLIVTTKGGYPTGGLYGEVPVDLCCEPSPGSEPLVYLPFTLGFTGVSGTCVGRGGFVTVYMTAECNTDPQTGCEVFVPIGGLPKTNTQGGNVNLTNAPDGDYTTTLPGDIPGYFTVVNGVITDVNPC